VEETLLQTFKTSKIMQHNMHYALFAERFAHMHIAQLINVFNSQVGIRAWSASRAAHDCALVDEFHRRGIDTTAIDDGVRTSFFHPIEYKETEHKITVRE